ncbi:MAG: hypothetical protein DRP65_04165 [Planctomycetota bacterium]|nr:MAG: hypothetical protein DRP65_04165 [Planctomycetota bacterium]
MKVIDEIRKWMDHNRFFVIGILGSTLIFIIAVGCTPTTQSPVDPAVMVTAPELELEYLTWHKQQEIILARFDLARADLEAQKKAWNEVQQAIVTLASGGIADLPGFMQLIFGLGGAGAIADNIRKRGLIAGLKRNK